jgi:GAF domain-containing protein
MTEREDAPARSSAAFPIFVNKTVRGTLCVSASKNDDIHDKEVMLLEEAASDLSFALDNFEKDDARRQAEAMLRNEQLFTDTMIESMPGVLYFYDMTTLLAQRDRLLGVTGLGLASNRDCQSVKASGFARFPPLGGPTR